MLEHRTAKIGRSPSPKSLSGRPAHKTRLLAVAGSLALVGGGMLTFTAGSAAADTGTTISGVHIVKSAYTLLPPGQVKGAQAFCPGEEKVIGGGALDNSSGGNELAASLPYGNRWSAVMHNTSASTSYFFSYAVCAANVPDYKVVTGPLTVIGAQASKAQYAYCGSGSYATGGGANVGNYNDSYMVDTYPVGPNGVNPDRWMSRVAFSTGPITAGSANYFIPYAICSSAQTQLVQGAKVSVPANGAAAGGQALCPLGQAVTGGGAYGGAQYGQRLEGSVPTAGVKSSTGTPLTADRWGASKNHDTSTPSYANYFYPYAVCTATS